MRERETPTVIPLPLVADQTADDLAVVMGSLMPEKLATTEPTTPTLGPMHAEPLMPSAEPLAVFLLAVMELLMMERNVMTEIDTIWMDVLRFVEMNVVTANSTPEMAWSSATMVLLTTTPFPTLVVKTAVFLLAETVLWTPTKLATALLSMGSAMDSVTSPVNVESTALLPCAVMQSLISTKNAITVTEMEPLTAFALQIAQSLAETDWLHLLKFATTPSEEE